MQDANNPGSLNRREALSKSVGYALAISPVTSWAISTPAADLDTGDVFIATGKDGKEQLPAYFAVPKKPGPHPIVIVVQEIFGLHEYIRDVVRRLAHQGYFAVSPYFYFRQGDATKISDIKTLIDTIVSKVSQAQVMADLDQTVQWAKADKRADSGRLGITGYCWGGAVTWMYCAHNPAVKAGVAWYGRLSGQATTLHPKFPLDIAGELKAPVLGLYGEKDQGIPLSDVEAMRGKLKSSASSSKILVFTGAEHGFHADYRPSYQEKAAGEAWAAMLAWFKQHGV